MAYRVDISRPALLDAENIYLWIKATSQELADRWFLGISTAIRSLEKFPNRCPIAPESRSFVIEIRQLLYGKGPHQCRIIFGVTVDDDTGEDMVLIYRIRNTRQQYLDVMDIISESDPE